MNRRALRNQVERALGRRRLVWFGTRGDDVEPLTDVSQLENAFSLVSTYAKRTSVAALSLEDLSGRRVDLDRYDVDDELRADAVAEMRASMLRALARPSALFAYRPTTFASAVAFARQDRCLHLGLFKGHQDGFEHKPWVETAMAGLGLPHIPWRYVPDLEQFDTMHLLADGPVMLRRSRTSGGIGLVRVEHEHQLTELWPDEDEAYVSVAPFIAGGTPVNVGAVAWHDGVTVHPASLQLIGVPECTTREFGYCGNDFGAAGELGRTTLDAIEAAVVAIGNWLRRFGYLGAFGVDFLVADGVPLFTEVNPRFQGSTHASAQLSVERDESCLLLEHVAAHLGFDSPSRRSLAELVPGGPGLAHIVVHHLGPEATTVDVSPLVVAAEATPGFCRTDVLSNPAHLTDPGATIARLTVRDRVTHDGFKLLDPWRAVVADASAAL